MTQSGEMIHLDEAIKEVEVAMERVALLHLAFSKILIANLGKDEGKELIIQSIMEYGKLIAARVKEGHQDLPRFGTIKAVSRDNQGRLVAYGCVLVRVFKELNAMDLGRLYCYVDAAKSMGINPKEKLIHVTSEACGDEKCTFDVVPTTKEERDAFLANDTKWKNVDRRLIQ